MNAFFRRALPALLVIAASCKSGTFVKVEMNGSITGVDRIELALTLGGRTATTTIDPSGGISLPTSAVLDIEKGDGDLDVVATAFHGSTPLAMGSGHVEVVRDKSETLEITFGDGPQGDLGADAAQGDLNGADFAPPADLATSNVLAVSKVSLALGNGTVTSDVGSIDCGAMCGTSVVSGTMVTLTAKADQKSLFAGWGGDCSGITTCTISVDKPTNVLAYFRVSNKNLVFVTSTTYTGLGLGGLTGADAICTERAAAGHLGGTSWKALLSTSTVDAATRLTGANGWVRVDGRAFANDPAKLFTKDVMFYPAEVDELGQMQHATATTDGVWTGSTAQGTASSMHTCADWTATGTAVYAKQSYGAPAFVSYTLADCQEQHRLYCFETDFTTPVAPNVETGRIVFVSGGFGVATGLSSADQSCHDAAVGASLPGTYLALLATTEATAPSRFTTTGNAGWIRPDGVRVTEKDADLFVAGGRVLASPYVTANLDYTVQYGVVTGVATKIDQVGDGKSDCEDYSGADSNASIRYAYTAATDLDTFYASGGELPCQASANVLAASLCLQQ